MKLSVCNISALWVQGFIESFPFLQFAYCSLSRRIRGRSYPALLAMRVWRRGCFRLADTGDLRLHLLPMVVAFSVQQGFATLIKACLFNLLVASSRQVRGEPFDIAVVGFELRSAVRQGLRSQRFRLDPSDSDAWVIDWAGEAIEVAAGLLRC